MKTRALLPVAAAGMMLLLSACERVVTEPMAAPDAAARITNGSLDGAGHPAVILIIMDVGGSPAYRCSGTLLSPTVVLTNTVCATLLLERLSVKLVVPAASLTARVVGVKL